MGQIGEWHKFFRGFIKQLLWNQLKLGRMSYPLRK